MKKTVKFGIHISFIILGMILFYTIFSYYLDNRISELYKKNQIVTNHVYGLPEKDKGNVLIEQSLKTSNLLLMGSSELGSPVPENPNHLFPNNLYNGDASFVGHASVQNALHAINLGANYSSIADKDVVIVESLQWFAGNDISHVAFFSNFSELQFYEFLQNDRISDTNKQYLCKRYIQLENLNETNLYSYIDSYVAENLVLEKLNSFTFKILNKIGFNLVDGDLTYPQTYILARTYSSDRISGKILYQVLKPYYGLRYKFLILKDKFDSYKWLSGLEANYVTEDIVIDWEMINSNAEKEGLVACTNNDLYVYDEYYKNYLADNFEQVADRDVNVALLESKEWEDFKFFLDVCNDLEIHPYVVSMSTNGLYYDHVGIDKSKRDALYNKIEMMSNQSGLDCLNLKDKEYEPYFYCDVMHLGWKGWPYVIQNIIEHFSETND